MSAPILGIDLGTTNSVVAVADGTRVRVLSDAAGNRLIPSVVSFHHEGDVLVGYEARDRRLVDAANTVYSVKRLLGRPFDSPEVTRARERFPFKLVEGPNRSVRVEARGESYALAEISAFVLREVRRVAEAALGEACSRAVVTVPANFNELQRAATKAAGKVAGLEVVRTVNEPTAAALAYGFGKTGYGGNQRLAVYDLGGGTFDFTILELSGEVFEVAATAGDTFLGGDDVDLAVADEMVRAFLEETGTDVRAEAQAFERVRAAAEWAKCQLTMDGEAVLRIEELGLDARGRAADLNYRIEREALERLAAPMVARTFSVCDDALKSAGVTATQLDAVILVGGSTRMPVVRSMVRDFFGREPLCTLDPDIVVAQGAAIQAMALAGGRASLVPGRALGRVPLRKATVTVSAVEARRKVVVQETSELRKPGPAFAPRRDDADPLLSGPPPEEETTRRGVAVASVVSVGATSARSVPPASPVRPSMPPRVPPPIPRPAKAPIASSAPSAASSGPSPSSPPRQPIDSGRGSVPPLPLVHVAPARSPRDDLPVPAIDELQPSNRPASTIAEHVEPVAERVERSGEHTAHVVAEYGGNVPAPPPRPSGSLELRGPVPPLLLDVTPQSLSVEMVDGYCEIVIRRNAAIPVEQTRVFSTARDGQSEVRVRVLLGESRRAVENTQIGEVVLGHLRPAPRGHVKVAVTFGLDTSGSLEVRAQDLEGGGEQALRVQLVGAVADSDIAAMQVRQASMTKGW